MRILTAAAISFSLAAVLFLLGYYYAWVSTTYGGVDTYNTVAKLFGYSSYGFIILGAGLLMFRLIFKKR